MPTIYWDASGLAKRYTEETGREAVDALFLSIPAHRMVATPWTYAETYSILLRRLNSGILNQQAFIAAVTLLQAEIVYAPGFRLLTISDDMIFASLAIMRAHNINSVDAALLSTYLRATRVQPGHQPSVLVTSDKRLERAAGAEHLHVLNPETISADDLSNFLATLVSA